MKRLIAVAATVILIALVGPTPAAQTLVPAPESVLGFAPCADYKLATYEQIADYFRKLDAASERLNLVEIGQTAEGRRQLMAIISSEANMKSLEQYRDIARRLALARDLTDEQAQALARQGKAVVWIDFGLHSTEVAPGQTAPLMAYRAVTDDSEEMRTIRDNVIFLLVPNMNPDGTTLVADWYMKHVGTPFEQSSLPELYHKYVGHDNNRDWFMFNMRETQNIGRQLYTQWFPQIVYNQHQTGPFPARIFIPPFDDPMNPNIPPLVMRGIHEVGSAMSRRFDREGKQGVISRIQYDTWWNGGMRSAPYYHNMVGILTEAQHDSATPAVYDPKTFPKNFSNGTPTLEPSSFYPNPFQGGEWHLRNTCDYLVTASMAVLDIGAKRRQEWLYDIYQMGRDAIRTGAQEYYIVPADQRDPGTATRLVNVLRMGGVDVHRATASFTVADTQYPAGSYVISGAQPFRAHLTDLLNPQVYPDLRLYPGGPPKRPYDITGWTLPYQMGVTVKKHVASGPQMTRPGFEVVDRATPPSGGVTRRARFAYAVDPRANDAFTAVNRLLKGGDTVERTLTAVTVDGTEWPAGTFIVTAAAGTHARVEQAARALGLQAHALDVPPATDMLRLGTPRVGVYRAWGGNMDEGWTRWVLEQFEFPFSTLRDQEIRKGDLRARYDVIVLPQAPYDQMLSGLAPGTMPPEFTGGMGPQGVANLHAFVTGGGTLVAMGTASELPLTGFGLPVVRNVTANLPQSNFYIPGSLLRIDVDVTHPVAFGMPAEAAAFFAHSPAFAVDRPRSRFEQQVGGASAAAPGLRVVAQYPPKDVLMSGWLLGESVVAGRAAVVEIEVDKGRVVLLGFRVQHRGQPHATFKLLFNSIYLGASDRASSVSTGKRLR